MYYVYILLSQRDGKLYIGSTQSIKIRLEKHRNGFVRSTKYRRPLRLIYFETYLSRRDAERRERFLKGGKGHEELRTQLNDTYKKIHYQYR